MSKEYRTLHVRVPLELYEKFSALLPMHGAPSWFVTEAMGRFVIEYSDYAGDAIARSVEGIRRALTAGDRGVILGGAKPPRLRGTTLLVGLEEDHEDDRTEEKRARSDTTVRPVRRG